MAHTLVKTKKEIVPGEPAKNGIKAEVEPGRTRNIKFLKTKAVAAWSHLHVMKTTITCSHQAG